MNIVEAERRRALINNLRVLEGALSYKAPKLLEKQYEAQFNRMTFGFEVEVAVEKDRIMEFVSIDKDELKDHFEKTFSYSLNDFLGDAVTSELIEEIDLRPKYGFYTSILKEVQEEIERKLSSLLEMKLTNNSGVPKALPISFDKIIRARVEDFVAVGLIDRGLLKDKMKSVLALYRKLYDLNDIIGTIVDYKVLRRRLANMVNDFDLDYDDDPEYFVWSLVSAIKLLLNIKEGNYELGNTNSGLYWYVNDENGNPVKLLITEETLNTSPYIEYDTDKLTNLYAKEWKRKYDEEWERFLRRNGGNRIKPIQVVNKVYELIRDNFDPDVINGGGYHDEEKTGLNTVVEEDGSVKPYGAEIVSKVFYNYKEGFRWLESLFQFIEAHGMTTNDTTGLHINIGTFKPIDHSATTFEEGRMDVVKLAILSGDQYLLGLFNRKGNKYAVQVKGDLEDMVDRVDSNDMRTISKTFPEIVAKLNKTYLEVGQSDESKAKYRTINVGHILKKNYLEFRIAGGENYHKDMDKIRKTALRFMQLCVMASDPRANLRDYIKALHKIISKSDINTKHMTIPKTPQDAIEILKIFARKNRRGLTSIDLLEDHVKEMPDNVVLHLDYNQLGNSEGFHLLVSILALTKNPDLLDVKTIFAFRLLFIYLVSRSDRAAAKNVIKNWYLQYKPSLISYKLFIIPEEKLDAIFLGLGGRA